MRVGFIGAGNMANALISKMALSSFYEIYVSDTNEDALAKFKGKVARTSVDANEVINNVDYLVLAIKPNIYQKILMEYREQLQDKVVISIAAGISPTFMQTYVSKYLITMPNMPASVGLAVTSILNNETVTSAELQLIEQMFISVGQVEYISESDLETMICLAGSSPAYFELVLEAMTKFGVSKGLDEKKATTIAANVMKACAQMQLESDLSPRQLADNVCSAKGTTIEAVEYFDEDGLDDMFNNAMEKCYLRALEMKKENDESL